MPPRKNNPKAPFVAKPEPNPLLKDRLDTGERGEFSDRIKIEPYTRSAYRTPPTPPMDKA